MERFIYLLNTDHRIRQRFEWISMAFGFGWGIFQQAHGQPFKTAAYTAVCVVGAAYTFQVLCIANLKSTGVTRDRRI